MSFDNLKDDYLTPNERKEYEAAKKRMPELEIEKQNIQSEINRLREGIEKMNCENSDRWLNDWREKNNIPPKNKTSI